MKITYELRKDYSMVEIFDVQAGCTQNWEVNNDVGGELVETYATKEEAVSALAKKKTSFGTKSRDKVEVTEWFVVERKYDEDGEELWNEGSGDIVDFSKLEIEIEVDKGSGFEEFKVVSTYYELRRAVSQIDDDWEYRIYPSYLWI